MKTLRRISIALMLSAPLGLGGCAFVAWVVAQFAPPQKVDAVHKMPEGKKILVFVDDFRRPVNYVEIKEHLTRDLNKELTDHKVAAETIPYEKLEDLVHATRDFNRLPIPNIGRKLGADLVIYVEIRKFSLKENELSPLWQGQLEVNVKAVDSETGLLWPKPRPDGFPMKYADTKPSEDLSPTYGIVVSRRIANRMARKIARLFYDHKIPAPIFGDEDDR